VVAKVRLKCLSIVCAAGLDAYGADMLEKVFAREADTLAQDKRPQSEEVLP
jgi:hypothetical protein